MSHDTLALALPSLPPIFSIERERTFSSLLRRPNTIKYSHHLLSACSVGRPRSVIRFA
jgi:hypothetical protein